jgi:hypothetical protein
MARKKRARGRAKAPRSSRPSKAARRTTPRRQTRQSPALSPRRTDRGLPAALEPSRVISRPRRTRNRLLDDAGRRSRLRSQRSSRPRLSAGLVQARRADGNASARQTRQSLCTRKKATRRAVIIATGHGGINGKRNYARRKKCR